MGRHVSDCCNTTWQGVGFRARLPISTYLADGLRDLLSALNHVLKHAGSDDVSQGSLSSLNECVADVADTEGGLVGSDDMVVDDRGQAEVDV